MEDNIQLMDNYLQGNLDKEGLKMFDNKLKQEPAFESDFRDMRAIQVGAKASARLSTLANLENLEASIKVKETTKINYTMKKLVTVAASLILIATVGYFTVFNETNVTSGPDIYNEFYQTYKNQEYTIERGDLSENISLKASAYLAYDSRDFILAASLFTDLLKTDQSAANYFYAGITNMEIGDHKLATRNLNTVTNNYEDYVAQSQWFLAMNLLKENSEGSSEEALSSLVSLALGNTSYKVNAEEVLAKMGISMLSDDGGAVIIETNIRPEGDDDAPDGSQMDSLGERRFQWGKLIDENGLYYRFFSDDPIDGLAVGDEVSIIVLKEPKGKSKMGFAFIIG